MAQATPVQEAGRPQPQTTVENSNGPFIRMSQKGVGPIYVDSARAMGGMLNQTIVAKPGYYRYLLVTHTFNSTGDVAGTVDITADAPFNLVNYLKVADSFGTPLISGDGYSTEYLIPLFAGSYGVNNKTNDVTTLPGYAALDSTTGAGQYCTTLPFEFVTGVGVIGAANASLPPSLFFQFAPGATVFGSEATGTFPTITTTVDAAFYWLPEGSDAQGNSIDPPGLGTTRQWQLTPINPAVGASTSGRIQVARLGGYLDTLIFVARDSTGARTDGYWPSRIQLLIDGVPLYDMTVNPELYNQMWIEFGAVTRPTGVIAWSRKTALSQQNLGLLDSGETNLSTSPGTLMELNGSPWGAGSNSPATLQALLGQIVPTGAVVTGLPEL